MKQVFLEPYNKVPCFTKQNLKLIFKGSNDALDERIKRALKNKQILTLKKGLYISNLYYLQEPDKSGLKEFISSKLRYPSYLSMEYVLSKFGLLTEGVFITTSITIKSGRIYQNFLGNYKYSNIKKDLFCGYEEMKFYKNTYFIATKAKALFDLLYLKRNLGDLKKELLSDLRINWENFDSKDFSLFKKYVLKSKSQKMLKILKIIEKNYA
ncbi:MAG: hypothetical protein AAB540_01275 [Patescibacteria group bacterium]